MELNLSPGQNIDLFLPASGYNLHWQWGVLNCLSENQDFWSRVDRIFGISGGSVATIYSYRLPDHRSDEFSKVAQWYQRHMGRPQTWNFVLEKGFKAFCQLENPKLRKPLNIGVVKVGRSQLRPKFRWIEACPFDKDVFNLSMASLSIPFVTILPSFKNLKYGFDGGLTLRRPRVPSHKDNQVLCITCDESDILSPHYITQDKYHLPILGKSKTEDFIKAYHYGRACGERFLEKNYGQFIPSQASKTPILSS